MTDTTGIVVTVAASLVGSGLGTTIVAALLSKRFNIQLETHKALLQRGVEEAKNRFTMGATSHMADVAFDKHVQFCEEYVEQVFKAMENLFRKGPHEDALTSASNLMNVRKQRAVWLTPEIESILEKFEGAFRKIGANASLVNAIPGDPKGVKVMYEEFAKVFGPERGFKEWNGEAVAKDYTMDSIIASLRNVLGIAELTRLRSEFIKRASEDLRSKGLDG